MIERVCAKADFARLSASGTTARSGPLRIRFVATELGTPRVAYAIGTSVGKAVVRNRLRRQLRSVFDDLAPQLGAGDYLVIVTPATVGARYEELEQHVLHALRQLKSVG